MTLSELREEFFEKFCTEQDVPAIVWGITAEEVWAWFEKELIKKNGSHSLAVYINDLEDKNKNLQDQLDHLSQYAHCSNEGDGNSHGGSGFCPKCYYDLERKIKQLLNALHAIKRHQELLTNNSITSVVLNIANKALEEFKDE